MKSDPRNAFFAMCLIAAVALSAAAATAEAPFVTENVTQPQLGGFQGSIVLDSRGDPHVSFLTAGFLTS